MKYNKENYVGKYVQLYPSDTYYKFGIITDLDDLGWTIKITKAHERATEEVGEVIFISHSTNVRFKFM